MVDGALSQSADGNIRYTAAQDVNLGGLDAGAGDVSITATGGSVLDGGDTYTDVTADGLRLAAGVGVGTLSDPLDTAVNTVAATAGSGGIYLSDADSIMIGTVGPVAIDRILDDGTVVTVTDDPISGLSSTGGGSVVQRVLDGMLMVNEPIRTTGSGKIKLQARDVVVNSTLESPSDNITMLTKDGASFSWTAIRGATRYYLEIMRNGSMYEALLVEGTSWVPGSALPPGSYTWTLRSWGPDGFGAASDPAAFEILPRPEALTPSGMIQDAKDLTFAWTSIGGATRYHVLIEKDGVFFTSHWVEGMTEWSPGLSLTFDPGTYRWTVKPESEAGSDLESDPTVFVVATIGGVGPPTALNPSGTLADPASATFTWTLVPGVRWYRVTIQKDGVTVAAHYIEEATKWTPGGYFAPDPGTYQWTVQPWGTAGYGEVSNSVVFTTVPQGALLPASMSTGGGQAVKSVSMAVSYDGDSSTADANVLPSLSMMASGAMTQVNQETAVDYSGLDTFSELVVTDGAGGVEGIPSARDVPASTPDSEPAGEPEDITGSILFAGDDSGVSAGTYAALAALETGTGSVSDEMPDKSGSAADMIDGDNSSLDEPGASMEAPLEDQRGYIVPIDVAVGPMNELNPRQNTDTIKKPGEDDYDSS
jgi:hypothetical protein